MKLATLADGSRDGRLLVVSPDLSRATAAEGIATTLQAALDDWARVEPRLQALDRQLRAGKADSFPLDFQALAAPLPRAYSWIDASAYLSHMERATRLRNASPASTYKQVPLLYDGLSSRFLAAHAQLPLVLPELGMDFEAELAVVLDDVPQGSTADDSASRIRLLALVNDVSLRDVIRRAVADGELPLYHGKPPSSMAPIVVTPDELGEAWDGRRLHLQVRSSINGVEIGRPNAGVDMHFDFAQLVSAATRMRPLAAGTVLGSGTVSNRDASVGVSCIAERRMLEMESKGKPTTAYLQPGDRIRIEVLAADGASVFGAVDQSVVSL